VKGRDERRRSARLLLLGPEARDSPLKTVSKYSASKGWPFFAGGWYLSNSASEMLLLLPLRLSTSLTRSLPDRRESLRSVARGVDGGREALTQARSSWSEEVWRWACELTVSESSSKGRRAREATHRLGGRDGSSNGNGFWCGDRFRASCQLREGSVGVRGRRAPNAARGRSGESRAAHERRAGRELHEDLRVLRCQGVGVGSSVWGEER